MNLNLLDPTLIVLAALRQRFGPEYERAVREHGSERKAEAI